MNNFIFENKTKTIFGKGCVKEYLSDFLKNYGKNVMLAYGGGSIKKNGVYDEITAILCECGKTVTEFSGIMPNALSTSMFIMGAEKAADYWREYLDFDMLLVTADGKIYLTEGIKDSFVPNISYGNDEINIIY